MKNKYFYEVTHRGHRAGFFKTEEAAKRYCQEFNTNIEGVSYPVRIVTHEFLDDEYKKQEDQGDSNWDGGAT